MPDSLTGRSNGHKIGGTASHGNSETTERGIYLMRFRELLSSTQYFLLFSLNTILLILAWHSNSTAFLVFTAFVPLFYLLHHPPQTYNERLSCYILAFLTVFLASYFTIYWIHHVRPSTHLITSLVSSVSMFVPYLLAFWLRFTKKAGPLTASLVFIASWTVIELLHDLNILGLPYGNLGHVLAAYPKLIQWYSITGSTGGTLWIFAANLGLTSLANRLLQRRIHAVKFRNSYIGSKAPTHPNQSGKTRPTGTAKTNLIKVAAILSAIVLPAILSLTMFSTPPTGTNKTTVNVMALHTSTDVYTYKYRVDPLVLLEEYLTATKKQLDSSQTNLIVWPENAITDVILFDNPDSSDAIKKIRQELINGPHNMLIAGALVKEIVVPPDPPTYAPNILFNKEENYHYKLYNATVFVQAAKATTIKVKKRLVPFSEQVPTSKIYAPLVWLIPNLAELNFSAMEQGYPLFSFRNDSCRTTPIICYGSAFSNYVADETRNTGANFLTMVFNEGWMKSKKSYTHFNWFTVCRTIENQRFTVKSSNEGITAIIDQKGMELEKWEGGPSHGVVQEILTVNDQFTFYTRHHKVINMLLLIGGLLYVLTVLVIYKQKHHQR